MRERLRTRLGMQIVLDPRSFENAPYVAVHEVRFSRPIPFTRDPTPGSTGGRSLGLSRLGTAKGRSYRLND